LTRPYDSTPWLDFVHDGGVKDLEAYLEREGIDTAVDNYTPRTIDSTVKPIIETWELEPVGYRLAITGKTFMEVNT